MITSCLNDAFENNALRLMFTAVNTDAPSLSGVHLSPNICLNLKGCLYIVHLLDLRPGHLQIAIPFSLKHCNLK
jgi:hypothetical protein